MPNLFLVNGVEKCSLGFLPTPLEKLERLSEALDGVEVWIKRDDCTGLGGGGNKTRKLEYLIADAMRDRADTLITTGALQSNHARQTAAAAARLGLHCVLALVDAVPGREPAYSRSGNLLLNDLFGSEVIRFPRDIDITTEMERIASDLRSKGRNPKIIPLGGSNGIGAFAYVQAIAEAYEQAKALNITFDYLVTATGSGGTQAGMLAGLAEFPLADRLIGFSVSASRLEMIEKLKSLLADIPSDRCRNIAYDEIVVDDSFVEAGYGISGAPTIAAVRRIASEEGILLDPVYTGKAMAGLLHYARNGKFEAGSKVLFWHTGGSTGLFGYCDDFLPA